MTVLRTVQRVCPKIGLDIPTTVFGSTDRELIELATLANDMAERIAQCHDWQALTVEHSFVGDNVTEAFDFPPCYDRLILNGDVWNSRTNNPVDALDHNTWLGRETRGFDVYSAYNILGNQMRCRPILEAGETNTFMFVSRRFAVGVDGNTKVGFNSDDDEFRLPERILRLGMIWQWRESKGLPYAEDMATYEEVLAKEVRSERGAKMLVVGGNKLRGYKTAYPHAIVS